MAICLKGIKGHNGFLLENESTLGEDISVLIGKNGSGKTRILESIREQLTSVEIDGQKLQRTDIVLIESASLIPNLGTVYNDTQFQQKITSTLQLYDRIKATLDKPYDSSRAQSHGRGGNKDALDPESLHMLCQSIAKKTNKPAPELSHEDIILHYEEPSRNVLGIQNISTIFNNHIKRKNNNQYNEWKCKEKGADVQYWSDEEFLQKFGDKPWVRANKILDDTFDGKFEFNIPDELSQSYTYQAKLIQKYNGQAVTVGNLSSGEKTLLWLALTLFNLQYYESDLVKPPKLLLIDEPDAFLHPKMVDKMYKAFDSFVNIFKSNVVITTHSPTTAALAPAKNLYLVQDNAIENIEQDRAISELLDGVTQMSITATNRRQVYVESFYDADIYQALYNTIAPRSDVVDAKISLSFVSSGPKIPVQFVKDKVRQLLEIHDDKLLDEFVSGINGSGSCEYVIGQVQALSDSGNKTVRGVIDWDKKNTSSCLISVFAENHAYSVENICLDPISILLLLHIDHPTTYTMPFICGKEVDWENWINDAALLQVSVDKYLKKILLRDNNKDVVLSYLSGVKLDSDKEYLQLNGHDLEKLVREKYPQLNAYARKGKDGELKSTIVTRSMVTIGKSRFVPDVFESVFASLQK